MPVVFQTAIMCLALPHPTGATDVSGRSQLQSESFTPLDARQFNGKRSPDV
jgi:hypothetical protein